MLVKQELYLQTLTYYYMSTTEKAFFVVIEDSWRLDWLKANFLVFPNFPERKPNQNANPVVWA